MTEKAQTFIEQNRTWFSWGSMATLLVVAVWLIQSMNGLSNGVSILNTKLDNITNQSTARTIYVDSRLADLELRTRECEKKFN